MRVFVGKSSDSPEMICAVLLESLPLVYSSIEEHQADNSFCKKLRQKILTGGADVHKFQIHKNLVFFFPKNA